MQFPAAVLSCSTQLQYSAAVPDCSTQLQYPAAVLSCGTRLQFLAALPSCSTQLQYPALGSQPAGSRQCTTVIFRVVNLTLCGTGSSVVIATELRAGRTGIEARWRRDFPPVQTGPGDHRDSCTMGTVSLPGVEAAGRWE